MGHHAGVNRNPDQRERDRRSDGVASTPLPRSRTRTVAVRVPANAPRGQVALLATVGCGQCHGVTFNNPAGRRGRHQRRLRVVQGHGLRPHERDAGTPEDDGREPERADADGHLLASRLPESILQEIWSVREGSGLPRADHRARSTAWPSRRAASPTRWKCETADCRAKD